MQVCREPIRVSPLPALSVPDLVRRQSHPPLVPLTGWRRSLRSLRPTYFYLVVVYLFYIHFDICYSRDGRFADTD